MQTKPNVLLIHAEQHRYDCLGAYGNADICTPNIDGLANDGVVFENSFCPYPICTPSRYSLLTGLYVHQHLGRTNRSTLPAGIPTFPRQFKEHGYRTTAVGKMHFTPTYLDVGFDNMWLAEQNGPGRYEDDYHRWLMAQGLYDRVDLIDQEAEFRKLASPEYWETFGAMQSDLDEDHHSTTWIGKQVCDEIENWSSGSNLLMVGFIKPHHPFDPPAPWSAMYDPDSLFLLPGWTETTIHGDDGKGYFDFSKLSEETLRHVMAFYYASISQIDHHVGKIVNKLRALGLYDNTMIIYTSDHGDYMGSHHRLLKGYRMLESLVRVPLIVKYAGTHNPRGRDARLVNNVDVAPTILSAAGLPIPDTMSGLDLTKPERSVSHVFAETEDEYMVRTANEKLLLFRDEEKSLFFDLRVDPLELTNLYHSPAHQSRIQELARTLRRWLLFESQPPWFHLDSGAAIRRAMNVPKAPQSLYGYFKGRMEENTTLRTTFGV